MSSALKIGISCYASAGGSGIVASELGLAMAARVHELHFITSRVPFRVRDRHDRVCVHTVEMLDYPLFEYPPYTLALAVKMHQVASFQGLDLMHVHYAIPHAASALLASSMSNKKIPIVTTLHGTDITLVGNHPSYHRITRHCIEQSDRVTAVSDWLGEETRRIFKTDKRIDTIPNFIDAEIFHPRVDPVQRARFAGENELIILHASNFRPVKRADWVVEVFSRLEHRDRAVLILAGDGPELAKSEYKVRELGLADRVRVLGTWERMDSLLPLADLYLQPSEYESFGLAPLEAMSAGVPVLVTKNGGPSEVIADGKDGFLLDPLDIGAWVACADRLLADRELRQRVGQAARQTALERYGLKRVVDQYEVLFQDLVVRPGD